MEREVIARGDLTDIMLFADIVPGADRETLLQGAISHRGELSEEEVARRFALTEAPETLRGKASEAMMTVIHHVRFTFARMTGEIALQRMQRLAS